MIISAWVGRVRDCVRFSDRTLPADAAPHREAVGDGADPKALIRKARCAFVRPPLGSHVVEQSAPKPRSTSTFGTLPVALRRVLFVRSSRRRQTRQGNRDQRQNEQNEQPAFEPTAVRLWRYCSSPPVSHQVTLRVRARIKSTRAARGDPITWQCKCVENMRRGNCI